MWQRLDGDLMCIDGTSMMLDTFGSFFGLILSYDLTLSGLEEIICKGS
jgi:hypothetical protein